MALDEPDTKTGMHMGDIHDDVDVDQHMDGPIVDFDLKSKRRKPVFKISSQQLILCSID